MSDASIAGMARALRAGETTSEALTQAALEVVALKNPRLDAFILVTEARALDDARRADAELQAGRPRGPFHGIPYGLKDIYDTAGIPTTCHSKLRLDVVPETDSVVAAKLHHAGGVLIGKLATHEFAIGGPSFDLPFPPARNPWHTDHITGGSSSGSGAAIASGMVRTAMGSDTGGSIRNPAAYCGTVGLKPTYGRVSRRGVFPLSYTLDHCGPLAASVEDIAITMQVIAGYDPLDPASADVPVNDYSADLERGVAGLRVGIPRSLYASSPALTDEVNNEIERIAELLREAGAIVEDVELPPYALFAACGRVIMISEAFAIHEHDLRTRPQDYARMTLQRVVPGAAVTAADLVQAFRVRRELAAAADAVLNRHDALLTAGALAAAPKFGVVPDVGGAASPLQMFPWNVTGHPALAIPTSLSNGGLPLGVQLVGRAFDEATLLRAGRAVERTAGWNGTPPI